MNESRPQPVLFWFHVKPALSPGSAHHVAHASPAVHVVAIGFTELVQHTARDSCRLKQMHLPRLPRQEVFHLIGHDVLTGRSPAATLQRHPVGPHLLQHMTCLAPGKERPSRVSSSNLEPRHQFSVTSAEFYGTYPPDASPLVSRETCSRAWCWHHGNANITLQPSLPGKVGTVHPLSVPGMPDTTVSTQ